MHGKFYSLCTVKTTLKVNKDKSSLNFFQLHIILATILSSTPPDVLIILPFMPLHFLCTQCSQKTQNIELLLTLFLHTNHDHLPELLSDSVSKSLIIVFVFFIFIQCPLVSIPSFHFLNF